MDTKNANNCFKRGMSLLKQGRLTEASELFRQLVDEGSTEPLHLSYHGFLLATVRNKPDLGLEYCQRAVSLGEDEPAIYLNLVRAHEKIGERGKAVRFCVPPFGGTGRTGVCSKRFSD